MTWRMKKLVYADKPPTTIISLMAQAWIVGELKLTASQVFPMSSAKMLRLEIAQSVLILQRLPSWWIMRSEYLKKSRSVQNCKSRLWTTANNRSYQE